MKSRHWRKRKLAYDRVLVDNYGQDYHIVEKRFPDRRKNVCNTYVIKKKKLGKGTLQRMEILTIAQPYMQCNSGDVAQTLIIDNQGNVYIERNRSYNEYIS